MNVSNFTIDDYPEPFDCTYDTEFSYFCYHRHIAGNIVGSLITIIIAIISITGNAAVVIATCWSEPLRVQTGNILIVGLSILDILTPIFVMIPSAIAVALDYWPFGRIACRINSSLNYYFACSSSTTLTAISMDRAFAVMFPFKYKTVMTKNVMCILFGMVLLNGFFGMSCGAPDWSRYNYSEAVCTMAYDPPVFPRFYMACTACYYVPCLIILICNAMIIITANRSSKKAQTLFVKRDNAKNKEKSQSDSDMRKTIKSMIVVIITYYICFSPYALSKQAKVALQVDMPHWFNYASTILIFIASATNPFIYAILRKDYRDAFKKIPRMFSEKFLN